jgi:uncharacterized tellurite resistance protein B-like protein
VFASIGKLFQDQLALIGGPSAAASVDAGRLATAALLLEMTRADATVDDIEQVAVEQALVKAFDLSADELAELVELAEAERDAAVCLHRFTRQINDNLDNAQKIRLLENLWQVAFADGNIDRYEDHFARKVAELLYVSHSSFIAAKLRVQAKANADS